MEENAQMHVAKMFEVLDVEDVSKANPAATFILQNLGKMNFEDGELLEKSRSLLKKYLLSNRPILQEGALIGIFDGDNYLENVIYFKEEILSLLLKSSPTVRQLVKEFIMELDSKELYKFITA